MRVVYKYPLEVTDSQVVNMPVGAQILTVQTQHGYPCLWADVPYTDDMGTSPRTILTFGTGHPSIPDFGVEYIGTYQLHGGELVFHVYEATT